MQLLHNFFKVITFNFFFIFIFYILSLSFSHSETISISLEQLRNNNSGKIIFLRHAFAPGYGDPENFNINDCSTQRNLSEEGIKQAIKIGNYLKKIIFKNKFSSFWCRCLDTSKYLSLGKFIPHKGLNSFYEMKVDRDNTLNSLNNLITQLNVADGPTIMVTHYVTILAITGLTVSSGGVVVYDIKTKKSKYLIINN
jgi:hypothetical protein